MTIISVVVTYSNVAGAELRSSEMAERDRCRFLAPLKMTVGNSKGERW
jgi:hypothetical protein